MYMTNYMHGMIGKKKIYIAYDHEARLFECL